MLKRLIFTGLVVLGLGMAAAAPSAAAVTVRYSEGGYVDCSVYKSENRSLTSSDSTDTEAERRCCSARLGEDIRTGVDALCPISTYKDN